MLKRQRISIRDAGAYSQEDFKRIFHEKYQDEICVYFSRQDGEYVFIGLEESLTYFMSAYFYDIEPHLENVNF